MNDDIKKIHIEDFIWIIYIFIIFFNLYSNRLEEEYLKTNNKLNLIKYKKINKIILTIVLIIYIYFLYISYKDYNKNKNIYTYLAIIANILFVLGGALSLYLASKDYETINDLPII